MNTDITAKPNIAIIRWDEDFFMQIKWAEDGWSLKGFSLADPDDDYHDLKTSQILFAIFDEEAKTSKPVVSFTATDDDGEELDLAGSSLRTLFDTISHILLDSFGIE